MLVAAGGFVMTWWLLARVTEDRWCLWIGVGSYFLKILLAVGLFALAFSPLHPMSRHQLGRGFLPSISQDAGLYHTVAANVASFWGGALGPFPFPDVLNWEFILYVAGCYRLFGAHPLTVVFLNVWCGTLIIAAGILLMRRWRSSPGAVRCGVALLAGWPSLVLWSTQLMKDVLVVWLILSGLLLLAACSEMAGGRTRPFLRSATLLGLAVLALAIFKRYAALAMALAAAVACALLAIQALAQRRHLLAVHGLVVVTIPLLTIVLADRIDLPALFAPPATRVVEAATLERLAWREPEASSPTALPRTLSDLREGFIGSGGGSAIDPGVTFRHPLEVVTYTPRTIGVALFAPFPWQWLEARGGAGPFRSFAVVETLLFYLVILGAACQWRAWRMAIGIRTAPAWAFVLLLAVPLSLVVANLGTLFRLRLQFLLPLLLLLALTEPFAPYRAVTAHLKRLAFVAVSVVASTVIAVGLVLGVDLYLHHRYEGLVGLNTRGYRGPLAKRKQPGERRIVVLGGSTAFGYGVKWGEAFPAQLEQQLNARMSPAEGRFSVINLAGNSEGAYAFAFTLRDYARLDYDAAILYEGYNDLGPPNLYLFRHTSPIFRLTGYFPIFPLIFNEKAMALRHGGDIEGAYRGGKVVFRPHLANRASAAALEQAVRISRMLEQQLSRFASDERVPIKPSSTGLCPEPWDHYCRSVAAAVDYLLDEDKRVVVATQPYSGDGHVEQQRSLAAMLGVRYADEPRVVYVNLGHLISLKDPALCYDGMHLTASGNERVAEALVRPTRGLFGAPRSPPP
jgi:hypothetical protein